MPEIFVTSKNISGVIPFSGHLFLVFRPTPNATLQEHRIINGHATEGLQQNFMQYEAGNVTWDWLALLRWSNCFVIVSRFV